MFSTISGLQKSFPGLLALQLEDAGVKLLATRAAMLQERQQQLNALLDNGDELLVPAPDYPLWTAVASLSGGKPVHYLCDEDNEWMPNLDDIRAKITPRTKGLVVINPNNPTGALYATALLQGIVDLAREHGLVIFADEVYDKVLYEGVQHTPIASLSEDFDREPMTAGNSEVADGIDSQRHDTAAGDTDRGQQGRRMLVPAISSQLKSGCLQSGRSGNVQIVDPVGQPGACGCVQQVGEVPEDCIFGTAVGQCTSDPRSASGLRFPVSIQTCIHCCNLCLCCNRCSPQVP